MLASTQNLLKSWYIHDEVVSKLAFMPTSPLLRAVEWVHSVVISRGEMTVNETSPTSARYVDPILHASLHVYCMDHNSIE